MDRENQGWGRACFSPSLIAAKKKKKRDHLFLDLRISLPAERAEKMSL
jgi:hypothetical protein